MEQYYGKIYKITCKTTNKVYFGSTTFIVLHFRLLNHEQCYCEYKRGKRAFQTSFEILEGNDYVIELVENVVGTCKKDLLLRERYYIENYECVNRFVPLRTRKEYYAATKK